MCIAIKNIILNMWISVIAGLIGVSRYDNFKRLLGKHITNWYGLRAASLLLCIVVGVAVAYVIRFIYEFVSSLI